MQIKMYTLESGKTVKLMDMEYIYMHQMDLNTKVTGRMTSNKVMGRNPG